MREYTYIAADFDNDNDAVKTLLWMNANDYIDFNNAHAIQQSYDDSLACSIKRSLMLRMDESNKFVLIVGTHTNTVSKGGCQLCGSYNSYTSHCARNGNIDYRSFIKFECDKAVEAGIKIVVLYKDQEIERDLCPEVVRWKGTHRQMIYRGNDGQLHWDLSGIAQAFNS